MDVIPLGAVSLLSALPGALYLLPFWKKGRFSFPEALVLGTAFGFIVVPTMLYVEYLLGIAFSKNMLVVNTILFIIGGIVFCMKERIWEVRVEKDWLKRNWYWVVVLFIAISATWLRWQSHEGYPHR